MTVYYLTILATVITSYLAKSTSQEHNSNETEISVNYNKFFVILTAAILIFVAGLRWRVGTDYVQYSLNYYGYSRFFWESIINFDEPGLNIIARVSSFIYDDYVTMFFIASAITIWLIIRTISKHSDMFVLSVLLFILIGAWHGSFNGVRQYLACAVIFAGHRYIIERNFKKYLLVIILAAMFHMTGAFMIILYFVPVKKLKPKHVLLLIAATIVIVFSYDFIFSFIENIQNRELPREGYITANVNILRVAVTFPPIIIYYLFFSKKKLNKEDYFYINMLFVFSATMVSTMNSSYLARLGIYTGIFNLLSFPRILKFDDKSLKYITSILVIASYIYFWYVEVSNSWTLHNFRWIWER